MSWIRRVEDHEARGRLARLYESARSNGEPLDNILLVHGLRPHTLDGHLGLYRSVLHHGANTLPRWQLELVGVYVSMLNGCDYCVVHHLRGLARLVGEDEAERLRRLLAQDNAEALPSPLDLMLRYAAVLTRMPTALAARHVEELRNNGLGDGEILELNQVAAYFNYVNRTVLGLGVGLEPDIDNESTA